MEAHVTRACAGTVDIWFEPKVEVWISRPLKLIVWGVLRARWFTGKVLAFAPGALTDCA